MGINDTKLLLQSRSIVNVFVVSEGDRHDDARVDLAAGGPVSRTGSG